jgi:uncharacterized protein
VKQAARRWALLVAVGLLVVVLVGGRWAAFETAERVWATSLPGGRAYLQARDFARLVSGLLLLVAVAWGTGNLLFVYRSIGSMQLSRRLGDLEIVEAVPQPILLAGTVASGLVYGFLLALGTGDWWMSAVLAAHGVGFGVTDPVLHRDIGYYLATLPWSERLRSLALAAVGSATIVVGLLYAGIGSLRFRRWLPSANAHARAHLGLLLALLALTLTWGAVLDPAQTVAGLHGDLTGGAVDARLTAAPVVAALGAAATAASVVWGVREKPALLLSAWGALLAASLLGFVVIPGSLAGRAGRGTTAGAPDTVGAAATRQLEELAFGVTAPIERPPPGFASPEAAVAGLPLWNSARVMAAAAQHRDLLGPGARPAAAGLAVHSLVGQRATWIIAPAPDLDAVARTAPPPDWTTLHRGAWARVGRPIAAVEDDTVLQFEPLPTRDSVAWFGPGFREFAIAAPDTWPALRRTGIPLTDWWRRTALAWVLQSPALARRETDGLVLLWRRDVTERLRRLAPYAAFEAPAPIVADGALWWVSYGYLEADAFPLARAVESDGRPLRYLRAALVGTVNAASGDTRLYLAPGADSLAAAWAAVLAPLIQPLDSLRPGLRGQLPFPSRVFRVATTLVRRWRSDTTEWTARPRDPFELLAPAAEGRGDAAGARPWTAQGFEAGSSFVALVAGTMLPSGPQVLLWRPDPGVRLLPPLVGSPTTTAPGIPRLWNVAGELLLAQALFAEPSGGGPPLAIDTLYLSWGERRGQGRSRVAALRALLALGGAPEPADTTLGARWQLARRLAAQADAALAAGDLETFGRLYGQLKDLLGIGRRKLAPIPDRR